MNAKPLVLLSAFVYAFLPLFAILGGQAFVESLVLILPLAQSLMFLPFVLFPQVRKGLALAFRHKELAATLVGNGVLFVMAMIFLAKALQTGHAPLAVLISELWPVATALTLGWILRRPLTKLNATGWAQAGLGVTGLALVAGVHTGHMAIDPVSVFWALMAALALGLCASVKARAMDILHIEATISPLASMSVLMIFFLPGFLSFLVLGSLWPHSLFAWPNLETVQEGVHTILLMALFNAVTALLFTLATLRMTQAHDTLLWFLSPVFAIGVLAVFTSKPIGWNDFLGAVIVVTGATLPALVKVWKTHSKREHEAK